MKYLPKLKDFLRSDNELKWRFRYELAEQLFLTVTLFKPVDSVKYIGKIALTLLSDKVAAVRRVSLTLVSSFFNIQF